MNSRQENESERERETAPPRRRNALTGWGPEACLAFSEGLLGRESIANRPRGWHWQLGNLPTLSICGRGGINDMMPLMPLASISYQQHVIKVDRLTCIVARSYTSFFGLSPPKSGKAPTSPSARWRLTEWNSPQPSGRGRPSVRVPEEGGKEEGGGRTRME